MCLNGPSGKSFILVRLEWILHYFFIYSVLCTEVGGLQNSEISDCNGKHLLFSHSFLSLTVMGHKKKCCLPKWRQENFKYGEQGKQFSDSILQSQGMHFCFIALKV